MRTNAGDGDVLRGRDLFRELACTSCHVETFVTGTGYTQHYAQVIRLKGGADVKIDGVVVAGYYAVGEYEVADWKINQGGHFAESDAPFGILNIGYTGVTSYAYPGGLKLAVINPQ